MNDVLKSVFRFNPELAKQLFRAQKKLQESEERERQAFDKLRERRISIDPRPASKRPSAGPKSEDK